MKVSATFDRVEVYDMVNRPGYERRIFGAGGQSCDTKEDHTTIIPILDS
jgi:hypothetical protein